MNELGLFCLAALTGSVLGARACDYYWKRRERAQTRPEEPRSELPDAEVLVRIDQDYADLVGCEEVPGKISGEVQQRTSQDHQSDSLPKKEGVRKTYSKGRKRK